MDDLISRQAVLDMLEEMARVLPTEVSKAVLEMYKELKERLDASPTIDAVQVVRCKDCKYSYTMITAKAKDGQERWTMFCDKHKTLFPKDDWFCKDGERKEE